jgi:hypothetical protein
MLRGPEDDLSRNHTLFSHKSNPPRASKMMGTSPDVYLIFGFARQIRGLELPSGV